MKAEDLSLMPNVVVAMSGRNSQVNQAAEDRDEISPPRISASPRKSPSQTTDPLVWVRVGVMVNDWGYGCVEEIQGHV